MLDVYYLSRQMSENSFRITELLKGVPDVKVRWKPDPESWSMLEVLGHLLDEERFDFRVRLDYILNRPGEPWPPIDPQGWVKARRYNEQNLLEMMDAFLRERGQSMLWLGAMADPDWGKAALAPWGATIRAGDMLAAWAAHDMLHMRQLVELHYQYVSRLVEPFETFYAGDW